MWNEYSKLAVCAKASHYGRVQSHQVEWVRRKFSLESYPWVWGSLACLSNLPSNYLAVPEHLEQSRLVFLSFVQRLIQLKSLDHREKQRKIVMQQKQLEVVGASVSSRWWLGCEPISKKATQQFNLKLIVIFLCNVRFQSRLPSLSVLASVSLWFSKFTYGKLYVPLSSVVGPRSRTVFQNNQSECFCARILVRFKDGLRIWSLNDPTLP